MWKVLSTFAMNELGFMCTVNHAQREAASTVYH